MRWCKGVGVWEAVSWCMGVGVWEAVSWCMSVGGCSFNYFFNYLFTELIYVAFFVFCLFVLLVPLNGIKKYFLA